MRQDVLELSGQRSRAGTVFRLADRPEGEVAVDLHDLAEPGGAPHERIERTIPQQLMSRAGKKAALARAREQRPGVSGTQRERLFNVNMSAALERCPRGVEVRGRGRTHMHDIGACFSQQRCH